MAMIRMPAFFTKNIFFTYFLISIIDSISAQFSPPLHDGYVGGPHFEEDLSFPTFTKFGQISGLAIDKDGRLHVFHRSGREWGEGTFDDNHQLVDKTTIPNDTIVILDPASGQELYSWGANKFYMPHGIFIDDDDNTWVTDVALHQVLRYSPRENRLTLAIGVAFEPGSGTDHLCQPTDVLVTKEGNVYIGDGYCNSRVLVYNIQGQFLQEIGANYGMDIPHSVALVPQYGDAICVADRENRRILCFSTGLDGKSDPNILIHRMWEPYHGPIYAIRWLGNQLIALAGLDFRHITDNIHATVFDLTSGAATATFTSAEGLTNPHDIAVTLNGDSVFFGELDVKAPRRLIKFNVRYY